MATEKQALTKWLDRGLNFTRTVRRWYLSVAIAWRNLSAFLAHCLSHASLWRLDPCRLDTLRSSLKIFSLIGSAPVSASLLFLRLSLLFVSVIVSIAVFSPNLVPASLSVSSPF